MLRNFEKVFFEKYLCLYITPHQVTQIKIEGK